MKFSQGFFSMSIIAHLRGKAFRKGVEGICMEGHLFLTKRKKLTRLITPAKAKQRNMVE